MGLLDGDLAKSIYAGFKGRLLSGVIRKTAVPDPVEPGASKLDAHGDPIALQPTDHPIEGFTEAYSAFTRATAGIPATDLQLNIFAQSIPGIVPVKDDKAALDRNGTRQWYQLRGRVDIDPAGALWVCQAFEIKAPV